MAIIDLRKSESPIHYGRLRERLFSVSKADEIIHLVVSGKDEALEIRAFLSLFGAGQWTVRGGKYHMVCVLNSSLNHCDIPAAGLPHPEPAGIIP